MKGGLWVVDDNELDVELTLLALERCGVAAATQVARSGAEALRRLRGGPRQAVEPPALVLLDLKMPGLDGHDVLKAMRADDALRSVPVVMFSASAEPRDIARSYALGANGYAVKPLAFEQLIARLQAVCAYWLDVNESPRAAADHPAG
jgi:CheY-like chemotaxis protein